MALTQNNPILATDWNTIKTNVQTEITRRSYNGTTPSGASYAYYSKGPVTNKTLSAVSANTVALATAVNPALSSLEEITGNSFQVTANTPIKSMSTAGSTATALNAKSVTASTLADTGCNASCTGLCYGGCYTTCGGCTG